METTTTHTPGPWAYSPYAGQHDYGVYAEATGRDVALVRDFDEANARLIAAAPEMYGLVANLSASLEALANGEWDDADDGDKERHMRDLAEDARALLAQIEGRS